MRVAATVVQRIGTTDARTHPAIGVVRIERFAFAGIVDASCSTRNRQRPVSFRSPFHYTRDGNRPTVGGRSTSSKPRAVRRNAHAVGPTGSK
ncbi:hypothetical protein, partial [Burkholderia sp. LMG 13014]|uniref:hypothetical protein n=1 Tax=Burkholderia sp. LMG 13014 TaxID=2709306 RepID=UPI0019645FDD